MDTLYGIDLARVLHIHGRSDAADDELVLGHAWNPQSRPSLNDRPDIEEIDTRVAEANDIIDDYFSATFKRSEELIAQHGTFFRRWEPSRRSSCLATLCPRGCDLLPGAPSAAQRCRGAMDSRMPQQTRVA